MLRSLFVKAARAQSAELAGKHAIVTGCAPNSIGFETARALAAWGATVTITTRGNPQDAADALRSRLPPAQRAQIEAQTLDLSDADSVRRFAADFTARHGCLDILVNNAGVHLDLLSQWKQPHLSADGHDIQWRINYLGTMHLTHALLPLLRKTGGARIVNVVSMLHRKGRNAGFFAPLDPYNSWAAYGTSKLALVHATFELQRREAANGIQAYCLHPGAVYTNIADKGLAGNPLIEKIRKAMAPAERFFLLTPEEGAQTSLYCATQPGLAGGRYFDACALAVPSDEALDEQISARLWDQTSAWIESLA